MTCFRFTWNYAAGSVLRALKRRDSAALRYEAAYAARCGLAFLDVLPLDGLLRMGAVRAALRLLEETPGERRRLFADRLIALLPRVAPGSAVLFLHTLRDLGLPMTGKRRQILAWHYSQAGHFAEALDIYREVLCQAPSYPYALYGMAYCLARLERADEAEPVLARLLAVEPNHARALTLKSWLLMRGNEPSAAVGVLEPLSRRKRKRREVWAYLGWCYLQLGRLKDAERAYMQAVRLGDTEPLTWSNLGRVKIELGEYPAAAVALKKAAQLDPKLAAPHQNLALLYARSGRNEDAELERAKIQVLKTLPRL